MNLPQLTLLCTALVTPAILAEPADRNTTAALSKEEVSQAIIKHSQGAKKLSGEQDELSADVQDLIDEQTDTEVIKLLREIEVIMGDATDLLEQKKTDGATIATETEVIEKIFEAAKKKQQKQGNGKPNPMLEMMQNMMQGGKDVGEGQQPGKKPGGQPGDQPGQGGKGGGAASGKTGAPDNTAENNERRVPKNSGSSGSALPREFQKAMDAYNKGAAKKAQSR